MPGNMALKWMARISLSKEMLLKMKLRLRLCCLGYIVLVQYWRKYKKRDILELRTIVLEFEFQLDSLIYTYYSGTSLHRSHYLRFPAYIVCFIWSWN
jgi:hypothetical protein